MHKNNMITELLYQTVTNIEVWQDVLAYLCNVTGAPKGIIMLRDKGDAELFISKNIHAELESPMLYGLSGEDIESYITEYYKFDPWTNIEKNHHPVRPYAMSKYLPIKSLQETKFWEWLEPQGINDSVVVELYDSKNYWISINLFLDGNDEKIKKLSLIVLENLQFLMNKVWHLGLQYKMSNSSPEGLVYFLEQQTSPSILIDCNLKVIHKNKKADVILSAPNNLIKRAAGHLFIRNSGKQKLFKETVVNLSSVEFNPILPPTTVINLGSWSCHVTLLSDAQNIVGEDTALRLLSFRLNVLHPDDQQLFPIWESPGLTSREKELVKELAEGNKVVDFQKKHKMAKSTAHNHWTSVKRKLQLKDRAQIVDKHRYYLENQ